MDKLDELEIENKALRKKLKELEKQIIGLKQILTENGLSSEIADISDEEYICVNEIKKLRDLSDAIVHERVQSVNKVRNPITR